MRQETENPAAADERLMRTLAARKGAAWREFAEALDRCGQGRIDAGGVAKVAGDLYFKEVRRVASIFAGAATEMLAWGLGDRGTKTPPTRDPALIFVHQRNASANKKESGSRENRRPTPR